MNFKSTIESFRDRIENKVIEECAEIEKSLLAEFEWQHVRVLKYDRTFFYGKVVDFEALYDNEGDVLISVELGNDTNKETAWYKIMDIVMVSDSVTALMKLKCELARLVNSKIPHTFGMDEIGYLCELSERIALSDLKDSEND